MREFHSSTLLSSPPPALEYLVEGLMPASGVMDLAGMPGSCKSTIALSLMAAVSTGGTWYGRHTRQVPVAWVSGEVSDESAWQRDLHRLQLPADTDIMLILPDGVIFKWDRAAACWETTDEGGRIIQRLRDARIGAVVIDTLGSVVAGLQEIDNDQQRQLARHLRSAFAGLPVLSIAHTNQQSAREELSWRLHYLSRAGGNGFPGAVRWAAGAAILQEQDAKVLSGRVTAEEIAGGKLVAFGVSKHNEMPPPAATNFSPMVFSIEPDGRLQLVAAGGGAAPARARAAGAGRRGGGGNGKGGAGEALAGKFGLRPLPGSRA